VSQGPDGSGGWCGVKLRRGEVFFVEQNLNVMDYYGELIRLDGGMDGELRYETVVFVQTNAMDLGLVHLFWN